MLSSDTSVALAALLLRDAVAAGLAAAAAAEGFAATAVAVDGGRPTLRPLDVFATGADCSAVLADRALATAGCFSAVGSFAGAARVRSFFGDGGSGFESALFTAAGAGYNMQNNTVVQVDSHSL